MLQEHACEELRHNCSSSYAGFTMQSVSQDLMLPVVHRDWLSPGACASASSSSLDYAR